MARLNVKYSVINEFFSKVAKVLFSDSVVDNLTSTSTDKPLSANQGKKLQETKVDKDGSKVLSEKDFTAAYENKLKGIADNANNYVHPATSGNKHIPAGGKAGQVLMWAEDGTAKWADLPKGEGQP